jgi:hypothetical protein
MSATPSIQEVNAELARQLNEDAQTNPDSPYRGKFVGIANGHVVTVADDLDQAVEGLRRAEPDPLKTYCLLAGLSEEAVHEVWGGR